MMDDFEERIGSGATLTGSAFLVREDHKAAVGDNVHLTPKNRTDYVDLVVKVTARENKDYQGEVSSFTDGPMGKEEWYGYRIGQAVSFQEKHIKVVEVRGH